MSRCLKNPKIKPILKKHYKTDIYEKQNKKKDSKKKFFEIFFWKTKWMAIPSNMQKLDHSYIMKSGIN